MDAHLAAACAAIAADAADHVAFTGDAVTDLDVADVLAHGHNFAVELVSRDQGSLDDALRPSVPGLDVQVRSADTGGHDADLDVAGTCLRFGPFDEFKTSVGTGLVESLHGSS
ncbi:hypothetical protein AHiyo8_15520 [Arthrobacter sp. Hiyo8]|nr:hypothetical protein AHiyo8_15520 [Arthrobacter sp. Hiyo8]